MTGISNKLVPDIRDLSMAGVKSYAGRTKAQYVNHLSQSVSGTGDQKARMVCVCGRPPSQNDKSGKGDSGDQGSD